MLNISFWGTPQVAVPFLQAVSRQARVTSVITSPDQPSGRGLVVSPTPVKEAAQGLGLPVLQPHSLSMFSWTEEPPDIAVVVAYGRLIPETLLGSPRYGFLNVHFSLLPRWRGAAPIQWALIQGDAETGVSLFRLEPSLDTGPLYAQGKVLITAEDDVTTLRQKLTEAGVKLLEKTLTFFSSGTPMLTPQVGEPTWAPRLKKEEGHLDWTMMTSEEIHRRVRGTSEWPGAFIYWKGGLLKIRGVRPLPEGSHAPGKVTGVIPSEGFVVQCRTGSVVVTRVQPEGRGPMSGWDFWNGARLSVGTLLDGGKP